MAMNTNSIIRLIFGLLLIFFGLNSFLQFMPPPQFNEAGQAFLGALFNTGFIFPIVGILLILTGLLFVINRCSPLAAVILLPVSLNMALFHIFLDFSGWWGAALIFIPNIYLLYIYRKAYRNLC